MPDLTVGGVGLGAGVGVAGRWARRHTAPAVVGHFIFSRLGLFGDSEDSGFGDTTDGRMDGRNRANPSPPFQERKIVKIYRQFLWRF